jgi:hypothetical protein
VPVRGQKPGFVPEAGRFVALPSSGPQRNAGQPVTLGIIYTRPFMQKTFLTLALVVSLAGAASAQRTVRTRSQSSHGVSLGLKAGGSLSTLVGKDAGAYESIYGFHAGVFSNISLSKLFAFQPELLYSQKGAKSLNIFGDYVTRRFHYVDVPLAFHVNTNGLFFEAGPQIGFLVAAQDKVGSASVSLDRNNFKTADIGYIAGLGYQRKSGLGIGFRYNGEFTNVPQSVTAGPVTFQARQRNSVFQAYLSYSINEL